MSTEEATGARKHLFAVVQSVHWSTLRHRDTLDAISQACDFGLMRIAIGFRYYALFIIPMVLGCDDALTERATVAPSPHKHHTPHEATGESRDLDPSDIAATDFRSGRELPRDSLPDPVPRQSVLTARTSEEELQDLVRISTRILLARCIGKTSVYFGGTEAENIVTDHTVETSEQMRGVPLESIRLNGGVIDHVALSIPNNPVITIGSEYLFLVADSGGTPILLKALPVSNSSADFQRTQFPIQAIRDLSAFTAGGQP